MHTHKSMGFTMKRPFRLSPIWKLWGAFSLILPCVTGHFLNLMPRMPFTGLNRLQELGLPSLHFHNMHAMDSAAFTKAHSDSSLFKKKTKNGIVPLLPFCIPLQKNYGNHRCIVMASNSWLSAAFICLNIGTVTSKMPHSSTFITVTGSPLLSLFLSPLQQALLASRSKLMASRRSPLTPSWPSPPFKKFVM